MRRSMLGFGQLNMLVDSSLITWLDAKDSSTIDITGVNEVSKWNDKSGYGVHFQSAYSTVNPIYNGIDSVNFTASRFTGQRPSGVFSTISAYTIFMVFTTGNNISTSKYLYATSWGSTDGGGAIANVPIFVQQSNNIYTYSRRSNNTSLLRSASVTTNTKYIVALNWDGINSTSYFNAVPTAPAPIANNFYNMTNHAIACRSHTNSDYFTGDVHSFVMYNRGLTNPEMAQVHAYLNNKYSVY